MVHVVEATDEGPSLFNALSIALGIEILSGRLDNQKDLPAYIQLLDEFEKHHPEFKPKTWDNLKKWLAFYNASKDMELLLAPVLFQLNQRYQDLLEDHIQEELFHLIWYNRVQIENQVPWWQLVMNDDAGTVLFPRLDNLESGNKIDLLHQLKNILQIIISQCNEESTYKDVQELLKQNSIELTQSLLNQISTSKTAYFGAYRCRELESMLNALQINLVEEDIGLYSDKTVFYLQKRKHYWNIICSENDFNVLINQSPPKLKITSHEAYQRKALIKAPTQNEIALLSEYRTVIKEQLIDNPGLGNCAFYAFAIALIDIIQKEHANENKDMYEYWSGLDTTLSDEFNLICNFDFFQPDVALLDRLQNSLRKIAYNFQLKELKQACVKATVEDKLETEQGDKESLAYKNAMKYKYKSITANTNYINFAALYFGNPLDIDPRFNPFAHSKTVNNALNELDPGAIESNFEELTLVPLFLKLIYGEEQALKPITQSSEPKPGSGIIEGMKNILKQFFWGLHQDLCDLATLFKVNLHTLENGINRRDEECGNIPSQHTVIINNVGNFHWTTKITTARKSQGFSFDNLQEHILQKQTDEIKVNNLKVRVDLSCLSDKTIGKQDVSILRDEAKLPIARSREELHELRRRNLDFLNPNRTPISEKNTKPSCKENLFRLHRAILNATIAYTEYSSGIWFSLFHRHGNTGRLRARAFNHQFLKIDNFNEASEELIRYLSNNNNGNTYPHSFRTMLIHELLKAEKKPTLQYTSEHFKDLLAELSSVLNVRLSSAPVI